MPQALLGPIALALFQAGGPIWLANALVGVGALGSIFSAIGQVAISFGVGALANAIWKPRTGSRSEDIQQSLRVAASDRLVIYGQFQPSGNWAFGDSKDGDFHKVIAICEGKLVEVINLKVDDHVVTLDVDGMATSAPFIVNGTSRLRIRYRTGLPTETHYSELTDVFPEWTSSCRGDGVVSLYATQYVIGTSVLTKVFPALKDTLYRIEGKFTEVLNPITGVTAWSDNAAGVIRDFMRSENGMRIPDVLLSTPFAQDAWEAAWVRAAETMTLKAGGTEPRYRLWGGYRLSDAPGTVLEQMLFNCDAQPILTRDGGLAIRIGGAPAPTVTLDSTYITAAISASAGMDVRATANRINSKFLSTAHDYQQIDADPWVNEDDIVIRGEIVDLVDFAWSPSHSQARRLMKLRYHRLTPRWVLTVNCRVKALAAFQEPFVNLNYTIGTTVISGVFEISEFAWNIDQDGILRSVTISLQSIDGAMYDWNPLTEEGTAPPAPTISVDRTIPDLENLVAVTRIRDIGGGTLVAYAGLTFDAPPSELYRVELQGKKTAETIWSDINVPEGATDVDGLLMDDGVEYEFRGRLVTISGTVGDWTSPTVTLTPTLDAVAPVALSSFSSITAAPHLGNASLRFAVGNDNHIRRVKLYRKATGVALDIDVDTPILTVNVNKLSTYDYVDGDSTPTTIVTNGEFATDTGWTKGTGWAIAAGKATHTPTLTLTLSQSVAGLLAGEVIRYAFTMLDRTVGTARAVLIGGTSTVTATQRSTNETHYGSMTVASPSPNTSIGILADSAFDGSVDSYIAYKQTSACAPQGTWDYYAVPFNISNLDGPVSGPLTVAVI